MITDWPRPLITVDDDFLVDEGSLDLDITTRRFEDEEVFAEAVVDLDQDRPWESEWDVFVSHASEDKERVVRPLSDALAAYGVNVWYDEFTLKPGTSLRQSIDRGIDQAEFGIVVISERFLDKEWTRYELEALVDRQADSDGRLLTVWHGISRTDAPPWAQRLDPASDLEAGTASATLLARDVLGLVRPDLARTLDARQSHAAMRDNPGDETVKINMNSITAGPRHRDRLPARLVERVRLIRAILFEGYPHSMAFWLEGFLRDLNPEDEIAHWEQIGALSGEAMLAIPAVLPELAPDVNAHDVFKMLRLVDYQEILPHLQENYPDELVNLIRHMISSPTVIDLLDPD